MKINFIGSFSSGYVGETADENHLANELEYLGHNVKRIPRDIWKAHVDAKTPGHQWPEITLDLKADINIICKWHHFDKSDYIEILRHRSKAPVLYWVWDYMFYNDELPGFHREMVKEADLYLSNEFGVKDEFYKDVNFYYFPFDCADVAIDRVTSERKYDVAFFGSYLDQGDRSSWLPEINQQHPVKIFSWNHEEWKKRGFDVEPAVYGQDFAKRISECKIILGFNVNDHCWGYWSNRVGKVLCTGGFLLQRYVPGMELFLRDGVEYFSSIEEASEKIDYFLTHNSERNRIADRGYEIGRDRFTSRARVKELDILMRRYLKGGLNYKPPKFHEY